MLQLNGKTLQLGRAFKTEDGRQFPANWLTLASEEERQAIGIVNVSEPPVAVWDQRFYWNSETPKDLDQLKASWTSQVKKFAGTLLASTDWYIVRNSECSTAVPTEVLSNRALIRTLSGEKEAAIAACADVPALAEYVTGAEYSRWEAAPEPEPEPTPTETPAEE